MVWSPSIRLLARASDRFLTGYRLGRNALLGLLFPRSCPGCSDRQTYPDAICAACERQLKRICAPYCRRCGVPFPSHWQVPVCPDCKARRIPLTRLRSVFYYEGAVREMILDAKFARNGRALPYLAAEMYNLSLQDFPSDIDAVIPVPLHRHRKWERRFNQAEVLAAEWSRLSGVPLLLSLYKPRKTPPQSSLSGAARRANLKDAFQCAFSAAPPRTVLLIDDVSTTGSTLYECAATLRRAGVRRVYGLTAARAALDLFDNSPLLVHHS